MPRKKTKTYLGQLAEEVEKLFHAQAVYQYAAICYRKLLESQVVEVLLITSRDTGRWVIPKGWPMDNRLPHQVAEREAWEEAGVRGKAKKKPFGYYTYLKSLDTGETVPSIVQVHLVEVTALQAEFKEKGQRAIAWFPPCEAAKLVREPELKGLLGKVENALVRLPKSQ